MSSPAGAFSSERKVQGLTMLAMFFLLAAFFSPIWWVSLTAPNYPPDVFPDGIKIHFYFTGVTNGCRIIQGARSHEVFEGDLGSNPEEERSAPLGKDAGLDCVHEMDTINHYVGMYPIVTGAPLEQAFSKYIFAIIIVLLAGFMARKTKISLITMGVGFLAIAAWLVSQELAGGGIDRFLEAYQTSLGTYFKDTERISMMKEDLKVWATLGVYGLMLIMGVSFFGCLLFKKLSRYLVLVIAFMPLFFILDFGGWLWFFGHHLHPWGAFTLKPFMPTIFGEGKVAQFSTYSYPHYGFIFLVAAMLCLLLAFLIRRKSEVSG